MGYLSQLLQTFLNRFTYRQRFIFFALIYIVAMPSPSFWTVQTQNILLQIATLQRQGIQLQASLSSLMNHLAEYQITLFIQSSSLPSVDPLLTNLQTLIEEDFTKIQTALSKGIVESPTTLGNSFSNFPSPHLPISQLKQNWTNYLAKQDSLTLKQRAFKNQKLIKEVHTVLMNLGLSFGLFLSPNPLIYTLSEFNLKIIPKTVELIEKMASLNDLSKKSQLYSFPFLNQKTEFLTEKEFFNLTQALSLSLKKTLYTPTHLLNPLFQERKPVLGVSFNDFLLFKQAKNKAKEETDLFLDQLTPFPLKKEPSFFLFPLNGIKKVTISPLKILKLSLSPINTKQAFPPFLLSKQKEFNSHEPTPLPSQNILLHQALKAIQANSDFQKKNTLILFELLQTSWSSLFYQKWTTIFLLITCTIFVSSIVMFRILTKHLEKLLDHIRNLSKGKFSRCFCSSSADDFGTVGEAFDQVSHRMENVVGELQILSQLLAGFTDQINHAALSQEATVKKQEETLKKIEETSKEMNDKAHFLASTMNTLSLSVKKSTLADLPKITLDKMQEKMTNLKGASTKIIDKLNLVQEKVDQTAALIEILVMISNETKLLSINAAIETANVEENKPIFVEITQHIEHFSDLTAASTNEIKKIIHEMSLSVIHTKQEANRCIKEISEGAFRLVAVSHQLKIIDKQREDKVKTFTEINHTMQEQVNAGTNMLTSITTLGFSAEKNIQALKGLHQTIATIRLTAMELQKVLDHFSIKSHI